jgi:hypothetical protein
LMIRRLLACTVIAADGSYRQPYRDGPGSSGWRVRLFGLSAGAARRLASAQSKRAIGRAGRVKRRSRANGRLRWWQHPLFGDPSGLPPPHLRRDLARRMRSLDEIPAQAARVAALTAP